MKTITAETLARALATVASHGLTPFAGSWYAGDWRLQVDAEELLRLPLDVRRAGRVQCIDGYHHVTVPLDGCTVVAACADESLDTFAGPGAL